MTNSIRFIVILAIAAFGFTSCKSKQKVAEITGANITASTTTPATSVTKTTTAVSTEPEVTRNESFTLSEGDSNALNSKYHVVVGSFKSQSNAKGLQSTLNNEGNNAIIVINEQGMYRVIIASFNEYAQARARINNIISRFSDAWVLVQKK